jgi:hypothetical protein
MIHKTPIHLHLKASELERLSSALAVYLHYDQALLKEYQYWDFNHSILHSLIVDCRQLMSALKKLSLIHNHEERKSTLDFIHCISKNINSYCRGLEYHSKTPLEYIKAYRNEVRKFTASFQKWSNTSLG